MAKVDTTAKITELEVMQSQLDALKGNFEGVLDEVELVDKTEKIAKKKLAKMVKAQEKAIALLKEYEEQKKKADDLISTEKEKAQKARNHRLIQLGGIIESYAGGRITNKAAFAAWAKKVIAANGPVPGLEEKEEPAEEQDTAGADSTESEVKKADSQNEAEQDTAGEEN